VLLPIVNFNMVQLAMPIYVQLVLQQAALLGRILAVYRMVVRILPAYRIVSKMV
jgi:hypothetical protein